MTSVTDPFKRMQLCGRRNPLAKPFFKTLDEGMRTPILSIISGLIHVTSLSTLHAAPPRRVPLQESKVTPITIVTDFFVIRPLAVAGLITAVPIATVALPFAAIVGNSQQVATELLGRPYHHAFRRHLGDFDEE